MRIVYYNRGFQETIGLGIHARGLLGGLAQLGHDVLTIPVPNSGTPGSRLDRSLTSRLPDLIKVPAREVRGRVRAVQEGRTALTRVSGFQPDAWIVRRFAYDYTLPKLVRIIGCPVIAECNSIAMFESRDFHGQYSMPWERENEASFLRCADLCVAVTKEVGSQLVQIGVDPERIAVIHNGVDVSVFSADGLVDPEVARWREGFSYVIGYCATVSPLHDLLTISAAVTEIASERDDVGFLFIGPTMQSLVNAGLDATTVGQRCLALGAVDHSRVPSTLRGADLLWSALQNTYGSPIKVFEYLALGRSTLFAATGSGVFPVTESGGGAVVPKGDSPGLIDLVRKRLSDPELMLCEGARGAAWVREHGTWAVTANAMIGALEARTGAKYG